MKEWITKSGYKVTKLISTKSSVFLLSHKKINILIDTSLKENFNNIQKRLKRLNITKLDYLILTHTHYDHAQNTYKIKEKYGAKVIVHKNEAHIIKEGLAFIPKGTNLFIKILLVLTRSINKKKKLKACEPDMVIDSGLSLKEYGFCGYILHTPGHTMGSMSVIIDNEIAVVGDAMFGISPTSIYPPFADNEAEVIKSWKKLLRTGCRMFLQAHGREISYAKVDNNYKKYSSYK